MESNKNDFETIITALKLAVTGKPEEVKQASNFIE